MGSVSQSNGRTRMERHLLCSLPVLPWCPELEGIHLRPPPFSSHPCTPTKMDGDPTGASGPVPPGLVACLSPHCNHPSSPAQAPPPSMCGGLGPGLAGVQLQEIGTSPDHNFLFGDSNQRKRPPLGGGNGPQSLSACPWALGLQRPPWAQPGHPALLQSRSDGTLG